MSRLAQAQQVGRRLRRYVLLAVLLTWAFFTTTEQKFRGALIASVFAGLEFLFTGIVDSASSGLLRKRPLRAMFSGYTTVDMWF